MKKLFIVLLTTIIILAAPHTKKALEHHKKKYPFTIPLEILFDNKQKRISPRLSPDGTKIAYGSPLNGVMNIWIKDLHQDNGSPVTFDNHRGIYNFGWHLDGKKLFYIQDTNGDENWRLYLLNLENRDLTCLTPFADVQARILKYSKQHPNSLLIKLNKDDSKLHDVYKIDLETKELTLVEKNPGDVLAYIATEDLEIKLCLKTKDGYYSLCLKEGGLWKTIGTWEEEVDGTPDIIELSQDNSILYLIDSREVDTKRLIAFNLKTFEIYEVARDNDYDINGQAILDPDTHEILAISYLKERNHWLFFNEELKDDFKKLRTLDSGDIHLVSRDIKNEQCIFGFSKDTGPVSYWLYNHVQKKAKFLFNHNDDLLDYQLSPMVPIHFKSRDGISIHGYLTLPLRRNKNVPLVLLVHGGPWVRDSWGHNSYAQFFANRGYACLQVNYRGSTGYGKKFFNAGNREWGGKMHDDLIDAIQWAIQEGIADPKKIAIFGGSYGGYSALCGVTFTPNTFACAVDVVGPSNLISLINSIPEYWKPLIHRFYKRVGNPNTEEEFLKSRSPLFYVDAIKTPLLIAQGANDPRVKQAESEQIVAALKKRGIPHTYLLFKDEGHGFVRPQNQIAFMKIAEQFLKKYLG